MPVHQSDGISLFSDERYVRLTLEDGSALYLWGTVYGFYLPNGKMIPCSLEGNGRDMLRELFSRHPVDSAIERIEGNFVGLRIGSQGNAVLFGDALNRKELFYAVTGRGIVASTGLEAVVKARNGIGYDQNVLANLLTIYGYYAPKKHTLYKGIRRLGVGEQLHLTPEGIRIAKREFQPFRTRPFGLREHREYVDIFRSAVEARASSSCNWIYMSSGYDSSAILAMLVDLYGPSGVRCVIGKMRYSNRSGVINQFELDRAEKIAGYFGVRIDVADFDFTTDGAIEFWKFLGPKLRDQHLYTYSAYNYYRLAEFIAKNGGSGQDAVFVGSVSDGAHNLGFSQFATILEHPEIGFREYSDKMASYLFGPSFFQRVLEGTSGGDFVYEALKNRTAGAAFDDPSRMDEAQRKLKYLASFFHRNRRIPFYGLHNSAVLTREGAESFEQEFSDTYLREIVEKLTPETLYSCLLHLYNSYYWQGSTERCMVTGVESYLGSTITSPYWDGRLQRFLSEMPEDWGRGLEIRPTKYPLKWMLQNAVDYPIHLQTGPHSYLYDVNPRFSHTSEFLFGSHVQSYLKEKLKDRPYEQLLAPSHFNMDYIGSLVDDYLSGKEFGGARMNDLLPIVNLCLVGWY